MKIQPLDDRVLVTPEESASEQRTKGGLYIPETAKEKPRTATVAAVGTDDDLKEKVKVGDRVLYGKYAGDEFELDGARYLILSRNELLAVLAA